MAETNPDTRAWHEPLSLAGAFRASARWEPEQSDELRRHARKAEAALAAARELEDDSVPAHELRREAASAALRAFLRAHGEAAADTASLEAILSTARGHSLATPVADALAPLLDAPEPASSRGHVPGPRAIAAERAITATLRRIEFRTRDELVWLRLVRSVALLALLGGGVFLAVAVKSRIPPAGAAQPVPAQPARPPQPPRPMPRPPAVPGNPR